MRWPILSHSVRRVFLVAVAALRSLLVFSLLLLALGLPGDVAYSQGGCAAAPSGLVSCWPGEGNANDVVDGNHGSLQNGASFAPGLIQQAFHLDGVDDFVAVPDSPSLDFGTDDFTVALWVNFETIEGESVLIEKYIESGDDHTGWSLTKMGTMIRFGGPLPGSVGIIDVFPPSIPTDTWLHVAVTHSHRFESGHRVDTFTVYWNGTPIGSVDRTDAPLNLNADSSLKFGHRGNPDDTPGSEDTRGFYLNGLIDEVGIFNRALTPSEIEQMAANQGPAVGGIAELPDIAGSSGASGPPYAALAGGLAAAVVALVAGGWYAHRRWLR